MTSPSTPGGAAAPARRLRHRRKRKAALALAAVAAVAVLTVSLLTGWPFGKERVEHVSGAGPLQSHTDTGTTSVYAPKKAPWTVTFGSYLLCSTSGDPITIDGIRYRTPVKPKSVSLKLRTVTPRVWKATVDAGQIGAALGAPPHFQQRKAPGEYKDVRAGSRITQSCADQAREGAGFTELLFVLNVGKQGGYINTAWIDYHVNGSPYTLRLDWKMVACGSRIPHTVDGTVVCDGKQT
ncbi:hypothetical protein GA0115258_13298 [Streptomyces sp. LamerLS-31b]|uniref:hypothetical protein n=1 Tax=Streptomyces sp. LamerLS-31b TaxID=1839765 RepID=UPI00081F5281|nr:MULTISPECIES: hypothetical protein [unclassified Streptomyces]SCG06282.1 hypothetical protein GA0115258_13298 [Streptomyces sp. LamerLS-31b]